jgi:flagella basal body P-ring formation protein FlgA
VGGSAGLDIAFLALLLWQKEGFMIGLRFRSLGRGFCVGAQALVAALGLAGAAVAQNAQELQGLAQKWAHAAVASTYQGSAVPLRLEVVVGALDSRLKLAPCGNVEPYLPVGARWWGSTRVGLRCVDGLSRWNVTLPATVSAFGNAWVMRDQLPAGAVLTEANAVAVEVNWAQDANAVLPEMNLWLGQVATRALSTGQTLRQGMVKPAQVFQAGSQVRVTAQGTGFQISSDAQALSAGVVGQLARVRMDNGRIASGTVLDTRTVKIDL